MNAALTIRLLLSVFFLLLMGIAVRRFRRRLWMAKQLQIRQQIGRMGEEDTIRRLEKIRGCRRILCNLYVPFQDGTNTTEIDAVMIHEKGIFVIENKNYSGRIYGDEEEYRWLQVQRQGRRKWTKHFYSPVRQNQAHIRHLRQFLMDAGIPDWAEGTVPYLSVITFNDKAKLKRIVIRSEDILVSESRKVRRRLKRKLRRMPPVLTRKQAEQLYQALKGLENPGRRVQKRHGRYLNHAGRGGLA